MVSAHCMYGLRGVRARPTTDYRQNMCPSQSPQISLQRSTHGKIQGCTACQLTASQRQSTPGGERLLSCCLMWKIGGSVKVLVPVGGGSGRRWVPSTEYEKGGAMPSLNWPLLLRLLVGWQCHCGEDKAGRKEGQVVFATVWRPRRRRSLWQRRHRASMGRPASVSPQSKGDRDRVEGRCRSLWRRRHGVLWEDPQSNGDLQLVPDVARCNRNNYGQT
jgi:hypothetical protein